MALASKTGVFYGSVATQELIITFKNLSSRIGELNYSQRVMLWVAWLTLSAFVLHSQSHRYARLDSSYNGVRFVLPPAAAPLGRGGRESKSSAGRVCSN